MIPGLREFLNGSVPDLAVWFLEATAVALGVFLLTLLILMVTRWGDRHATGKALCMSILLHVCFWMSWRSAVLMQAATPTARPEEPPIKVRRIVVEGDDRTPENQPGNTPVWEKPPETQAPELARLDQTARTLQPLAAPERQPDDPFEAPPPDVPELTARPEEPTATPELQQQAEQGPKAVAAVPMKIDEPTAEARPDVQLPSVPTVRQPLSREGSVADAPVERPPTEGAAERMDANPDPIPNTSSITAPADAVAMIPKATLTESIERRTSPAPVPLPSDEQGTQPQQPGQGTTTTASTSPFTRERSRTTKGTDDGTLERFRPQVTPTTPEPTADRRLASREGIRTETPLDGPTANIVAPNFDAVRNRDTARLPATYRLRQLAKRKDVALKYGGTDASEKAVEASLKWLAIHQSAEGFWDADGFNHHCPPGDRCTGLGGAAKTDPQGNDRRGAGTKADSGITGLAILAFLGAGYTHEEGAYADQVDRALRWLIRQQREDGYLGGEATYYEANYCHGIAAYAMAEALGMQGDPQADPQLREAVARAVAYTISIQSPDGGWRYRKGQQSDMSMFGWQLMALKSAEIAGIEVPSDVKGQMVQFLKDRSQGSSGGLASYRPGEAITSPMTAEALFCKQILGLRRENKASVEAINHLLRSPPRLSQRNDYYWYYGTLAMYQYGGSSFKQWNDALRESLLSIQRKTGHAAGSWDPDGPWGGIGGRVYSTALCTLCLEVYYRFLPLYQVGGTYEGTP